MKMGLLNRLKRILCVILDYTRHSLVRAARQRRVFCSAPVLLSTVFVFYSVSWINNEVVFSRNPYTIREDNSNITRQVKDHNLYIIREDTNNTIGQIKNHNSQINLKENDNIIGKVKDQISYMMRMDKTDIIEQLKDHDKDYNEQVKDHESHIIREDKANGKDITGQVETKEQIRTNATGPNMVNPHNFKYIHLQSRTCDDVNGTEVFLMIVGISAPQNFEQRRTIRETWGSIIKHDNSVRMIFLMGRSLNDTFAHQIQKENKIYKDIVQEDFLDTYRNLTTKSVAMLKWVSVYCRKAKYLLKADDDMFMNIPFLIKYLTLRKVQNSCIGLIISKARPSQDKKSKWYMPKEIFKQTYYPTYLTGTSYVISGDIVSSLYRVSLVTEPFWLEDVYITGICRIKIKAKIVMHPGFTYSKRKVNACAYKRSVSGHKNTPNDIRKIWTEMQSKSLRC